jgi:ABC-type multidrug transport system fused ATPase/permease subunit
MSASRTDRRRARAVLSLRVWKPIVARALAERTDAVAGLARRRRRQSLLIETALPLRRRAESSMRRGRGDSGPELRADPLRSTLASSSVFAAGVWALHRLRAGGVATRTADRLRRDSFAKLQTLEPAYFDVRPTGWLVVAPHERLLEGARASCRGCMLDFAWCTRDPDGRRRHHVLRSNARLALWALAVVPVMAVVCAVFSGS